VAVWVGHSCPTLLSLVLASDSATVPISARLQTCQQRSIREDSVKMIWVFLGLLIPFSLLALPVAFSFIKRSAHKKEPLSNGTELEFALACGMQLLIGFVLILLDAFTILVLVVSLSAGGSPFAALIPAAVVVAIVLAIPHAVVLDDNGIRQRRWLFPSRQTAWADIATVTRDPNTGRTFVWSISGDLAAVFSPLLAGQRRFEHEIKAHANYVVFERD
jgi:uncharacterized Tic20 family protein